MNSMRHSVDRGFSMVEVLLSITIGLLILIAIAAVYQSSGSLLQQQENYDEVHSPIKAITGLLKSSVTQAGYIDYLDAPYGNFNGGIAFDARDTASLNAFVRDPAIAAVSAPIGRLVNGMLPVFGCDGPMNSTANALAIVAPPISASCGASDPLKSSLQLSSAIRRDAQV